MKRSAKKLGEILIEAHLLSAENLALALKEQARTGDFLGSILVRRNYLRREDFLRALAAQFQIPVVDLKMMRIDWEFVKGFSASLILDYGVLPLKKDQWTVTMAIVNPLDAWSLKKAEEESGGLRLKLALAASEDMQEMQKRYLQYIQKKPSA